jgi:flavin reductase (DIM6/NTAB) family NADH-FMN oxidoreductase RutF
MDPTTTPRASRPELVDLDVGYPIWDRFFTVAPLVVIGTRECDGGYDLAPKHMATALGWDNYFGFVCTAEHATYQNIQRERAFTVSFPTPDAVLLASLAASPRCGDDSKPSLCGLPTFPADSIDGPFLCQSSAFLECRLDRIVDGFGANSLIAGRIVAAHLRPEALRAMDADDQETLAAAPLLAYLSPGRYAGIDRSQSFPYPAGMKRSEAESDRPRSQ